jgi:alanyl-tRNA synthetase
MKSADVRRTFLDFFASKDHQIIPSAPLVNKSDPTLLFVNSGMAPLKDIFTGHRPRFAPRVADTQKCLRVSGKHNDLEDVGYDTYHHTLFEMLGNWSFGDYFKAEAIAWAWELLTDRYGLSPDRLYVTVFRGDDQVSADDEAAALWQHYLPAERILRFGKKENFWEMGDQGPCGPCSEIHYDARTEAERQAVSGASLVNQDHPQVIEIWNLVFMQFYRKADGSLDPLPQKSVDTGMGFERLCMVLQGKQSTYDIDVFQPLFRILEQLSGARYTGSLTHKPDIALRVIVDHIRAVVFTIADGQLPSNTGAGYVIRRILRRASRYGFQYLNLHQPFLHQLVPLLAEGFGEVFPEIKAQANFIQTLLEQEEKGFIQKLERGSTLFESHVRTLEGSVVSGAFAFELFDTYGFPVDLTQLMAREKGLTVDMEGFAAHMAEQKNRSRAAGATQAGDWVELLAGESPVFLGYDQLTLGAQVIKYRTVQTKKGKVYQVVLDRTPFYAESGGQIGDTGTLTQGETVLRVLDTVKENDLIVHLVDRLPESMDGEWQAQVDGERRRNIRVHHSATHLVHAALRQVLGTHVEQRGSLVTDTGLRFDFSHFQKLTETERAEVERLTNQKIAEALPLEEYRDVPIDEARKLGAMALFGEKYGDHVRVIRFGADYSTEFCGGCHVGNTSEIRYVRLVSEASISAGVRRLEAVAGHAAFDWVERQLATLESVRAALKNPQHLEKTIQTLVDDHRQLQNRYEKLRQKALLDLRNRLMAVAEPVQQAGLAYRIIEQVELETTDELKALSMDLRRQTNSTLIVLGTVVDGKPCLAVTLSHNVEPTPELDARTLVKAWAGPIAGSGGGQPFHALAVGKQPDGLGLALALARG